MSEFPQAIKTFSQFVDLTTPLDDDHLNPIIDEITAIENILNRAVDAEEGFTYDRDFIEGLDVLFKTTSSIDITAGRTCISGTIYRAPEAAVITTADNLREGEEIADNVLYNVYAFADAGALSFEFSTTDHDETLRFPGDATRRWCGAIRRAAGSLLAYRAYGDTILCPTPSIMSGTTGANPSTVDLQEYIPVCSKAVGLSCYFTGQYSVEANLYLSPDSTLYWPLIQWQDKSLSENKAENFFVELPLITRSYQYRLITGNYFGGYLATIKINRRRY